MQSHKLKPESHLPPWCPLFESRAWLLSSASLSTACSVVWEWPAGLSPQDWERLGPRPPSSHTCPSSDEDAREPSSAPPPGTSCGRGNRPVNQTDHSPCVLLTLLLLVTWLCERADWSIFFLYIYLLSECSIQQGSRVTWANFLIVKFYGYYILISSHLLPILQSMIEGESNSASRSSIEL